MQITIDWNAVGEAIVSGAFSQVPVVGSVLSKLVGVFWPTSSGITSNEIWDAIKAKVEAAINEAIDENDYNQIIANLTGLKDDMDNYLGEASSSSPDPSLISEYFVSTAQNFTLYAPNFQLTGKEVLLLPLFAKMAQLHITLLRDGVLFGESWGWNEDTLNQRKAELKTTINNYSLYATNTYYNNWTQGHDPLDMPGWVAFQNMMVTEVMGYEYYWEYMDPTVYPCPMLTPPIKHPRELFQGPIGGHPDYYAVNGFSQTFDLDNSAGMITRLRIWGRPDPSGATGVAGFQVNYGTVVAPLMGPHLYASMNGVFDDRAIDSTQPNLGIDLYVDQSNPIVRVFGFAGDVINSIGLGLKDGITLGPYASGETGTFDYSYPPDPNDEGNLMVLSSIILNQGMDSGYVKNGEGFFASGAIFGFRKLGSYTPEECQQVTVLNWLGAYAGSMEASGSYGYPFVLELNEYDSSTNSITGEFTSEGSGQSIIGTLNTDQSQITFSTTSYYGDIYTWSGTITTDVHIGEPSNITISGNYYVNGTDGPYSWEVSG